MSAPAQAPPGQQQTQVMRRPQHGSTTRLADPGRAGRWERNIGAMSGLVILILTWRAGIRLVFPMHPRWAGEFLGFLAELGVLAGLAWWTAHLIRVHHRRMIRSAAAGTRAGAIAGAQAAGQCYRQLRAWDGPQWAQDRYARRAGPQQAQGAAPVSAAPGAGGQLAPVLVPLKVFSEFGGTEGSWLARIDASGPMRLPGDPHPSMLLLGPGWKLMRAGDREGAPQTLVCLDDFQEGLRGYRLATLHSRAQGHGVSCRCEIWQLIKQQLTRQAGAPVPAGTKKQEAAPMAAPDTAPAQVRKSAPARWASLASEVADLDPDTDTELLDQMGGEVNGMVAYGESLVELWEHLKDGIRLDPAAITMLHDVADAVGEAAEVMAKAIERFRQVYEAPRSFVADGGVLPKDGNWLEGQD